MKNHKPLPKRSKLRFMFQIFAEKIAERMGNPWMFVAAVSFIIIWFILGPIFDFSIHWQLFINSLTTVITFLMVFLIQNTQNRENKSLHLKLDELLKKAHGRQLLFDVEDLSDEERDELKQEFRKIQEHYLSVRKKKPKN